METSERKVAVGVFDDRLHTEMVVTELVKAGFESGQIGVVIPDAPPGIEAPHVASGSLAREGAVAGATGGAILGAIFGTALAGVLMPGVGLALVGGFLLVGLAGATTGSILGTLLGLGVPEEEARDHEQAFHSGRSLVTVHAGNRYGEAVAILDRVAQQGDPLAGARIRARIAEMGEDSVAPPPSGGAYMQQS
jgi:hypothetical protein